MKGLFIKDFYMAVKSCKMTIIIDIVFLTVSFVSKENISFLAFPLLISGMLPITFLSLDERCKWTVYSDALPYSRAQIVSAKYLIGLFISGIIWLLTLICLIFRTTVYTDFNIAESVILSCVMLAASFVFPALCLPLCFKFGTEKGRIAFFVLFTVIMIAFAVITEGGSSIELLKAPQLLPVVIIGIVAAYLISWAVSVVIYKNKEL